MSAGLAASTVAPGRTAPDASLTDPAMVPSTWALPARGTSSAASANDRTRRRGGVIAHFSIQVSSPFAFALTETAGDIQPPDLYVNEMNFASRKCAGLLGALCFRPDTLSPVERANAIYSKTKTLRPPLLPPPAGGQGKADSLERRACRGTAERRRRHHPAPGGPQLEAVAGAATADQAVHA